MAASGPTSRSFPSPGPRRRGGGILTSALLALLVVACGGDTLYDQPTGPTPEEPGEPSGPGDVMVLISVDIPDRMELTDEIEIDLTAFDPSGRTAIQRAGYSAVVRLADGTEVARTGEESFQTQAGDTVSASFTLAPDWLSAPELPLAMEVELYGWALNGQGRCRAAVPEDDTTTHPCAIANVDGAAVTVSQAGASRVDVLAVRGRTLAFPTASIVVGDLQVDTVRERAYVSNRMSNRLHVLEAGSFAWAGDVNVGAEPWGLHLNAGGDTLLVSNSGGTSVSHVSLEGTPRETVSARLQTRNTALYEIGLAEEEDDDEEDERPTLAGDVRFFDFSDRPQYVAQDAEGRILYSTRPTPTAPLGTVRVIERQAGWEEHETRVLARIPLDTREGENTVVVMNVDSIVPYIGGTVEIWDHPPGFPSQVIRSGIQPPLDAIQYMASQTQSDIDWMIDRAWQLEAVSFADTTYVATSRDREFVAFGDGGQPEVGRIVLWHAGSATISRRLTVADLVNNASERVRAVGLNADGSLGIARGAFGTYFFSNDLRLRGTVPEPESGGGGAALHPDHPDSPAPGASSPTTVAFTVSADRAVRILDTVHYVERGRLDVRDPVSGPLRVTPPFPSDNDGQGRSCTGPACVVAKVFALTDGGGVLVVDVHASDIEELP